MRKADMIDKQEILRQRHELGLTRKDITAAVSAGTVSNVTKRAAAGLSCWPPPDDLDDDACGTGSTRRPNVTASTCSLTGTRSSRRTWASAVPS